MNAEELSAEYQKLLCRKSHHSDLGDRLKFLKDEFKIKVKK